VLAEKKEEAGLSNFTARMLLQGTENLSASEFAEKIDELGAKFEATGEADYSRLGLLTLKENFEQSFNLFTEAFWHPSFAPLEIEKLKREVVAEIRSIGDRSYELTNRIFYENLYQKHPYQRSKLGTIESVSNFEREEVLKFYQRAYVPSNLVLAIVGDIDPDTIIQKIGETWGEKRGAVSPLRGVNQEKRGLPQKVKVIKREQEQITFNLGMLGVSAKDPDYLPLKLLLRILGNRLFYKYVYEEGIAYRMWTYSPTRLYPSPIVFEMGVSSQNFVKAKEGILEEIWRMKVSHLLKEELSVAKQDLIGRFYLGLQTNSELAKELALEETLGLGYEFAEKFSSLVQGVTLAQVEEAARKYLDETRYTLVIVGDLKE